MAWTAPRTWVALEDATAALFNVHLRDNFKAIGDAWTSYTPAWTGSTTNPVINNGTIAGRYMQAGKYITFRVVITMGSTTTYGSGQYSVSLPPFAATATAATFQLVDAFYYSGANYKGYGRVLASGTTAALFTPGTTAGGADRTVTNLVPFTFANTNIIVVSGTYESA